MAEDYDDDEQELIRKHRAAKAKAKQEREDREVRIWHRDAEGKEFETGLSFADAKNFLKNFPGLILDDEPVQDEGKDDGKDTKDDGKGAEVKRISGRRFA